jgi:serine protease Do
MARSRPNRPAAVIALFAGLALSACAGPRSGPRSGPHNTPVLASSAAAPSRDVDPRVAQLRADHLKLVTDARDKVFPALVNISVITVSYWGGKEVKGGGTGSGTIISPDGYIITNQHVANDGRRFRVTLSDKREVPATLVGEDPLTDLAIIKIDPSDVGAPLPHANFGESDALIVGDTVMAMGSPFSLSRTVTLGIVSNTERVFTSFGGDETEEMVFEAGTTGIFTNWIQHDALINPGNSGGPLVNMRGEVVGVNALGGMGNGFAIPAALAQPVARELIARGEVVRSQIGVALKSLKRSDFTQGVLVNSVEEDGPADKSGIKAGDLILAMNGAPITVRFPEEVPATLRTIASMPVGSAVAVRVRRGPQDFDATITTEKLLKERGDQSALRLWGVSVTQITERIALNRKLKDRNGALVTGVRSGSPSETSEPPLRGGDIIRSVNSRPVDSVDALVREYRAIMSMDPIPEYVLITFDRGQGNQVTVIKPRPDKKDDPPREVPKAWIGAATQPVLKELAEQLGHKETLGFRVTRVYPGTLAAGSSLRVGDIIHTLNGEAVSPRTLQDSGLFQRRVRQLSISGEATLGVLRDGNTLDIKVGLERTRIGPDEALKDSNKDFDLSVRELTFFDRDDRTWDESVQGVLVESAESAGWAGLAGVQPGDLIQRIAGDSITDIATHRKAMDKLAKDQPARVTFVVLRGNRTFFFFAEPDWKPKTAEEAKREGAK